MKRIFSVLLLLNCLLTAGAGELRTNAGGLAKTLDPALADDLSSRDLTALCYDTLLQYDYLARPYKLVPGMLTEMPQISGDGRIWHFTLRDDLFFAADPVFGDNREARRVTSADVKFSILRIADSRVGSPLYWMFRGRIAGLDEFREKSRQAPAGDYSLYDCPLAGIKLISPREFELILTAPCPQFLWCLAMPNAGIVSARAAKHYGEQLRRHPAGSGPFVLKQWIPNLKLIFERNPEYRREFFIGAAAAADRRQPLPLLDRITVLQIKQEMTAWMLFLRHHLDYMLLDKDSNDLLNNDPELQKKLAKCGISAAEVPQFEVRYLGFNFRDPLFRNNLQLRKALSLAYNIQRRIEHASGMLRPVHGPIPSGVNGYDQNLKNPWQQDDIDSARKMLSEAGYPDGIDPATGKPLTLHFDQNGATVAVRQLGELAVDDWSKIGVKVISSLNSRPRFVDKLRQSKFQIFRYSWIGDYPDAENFLQLFYSGNIGSCNYSGYSNPEYDQLYCRLKILPDSPEKKQICRRMQQILADECVAIFEGIPISRILYHQEVRNFVPNDFSFVYWKYLASGAPANSAE